MLELFESAVAGMTPNDNREFERPPLTLAQVIVNGDSHYQSGVAVARKAVELLCAAHRRKDLRIEPNEVAWCDTMQDDLNELPESESDFIDRQLALADRSRFLPQEYELKG